MYTDLHGLVLKTQLGENQGKDKTHTENLGLGELYMLWWSCTKYETTWNLGAFLMYSMVEESKLLLVRDLCKWAVSTLKLKMEAKVAKFCTPCHHPHMEQWKVLSSSELCHSRGCEPFGPLHGLANGSNVHSLRTSSALYTLLHTDAFKECNEVFSSVLSLSFHSSFKMK